MDEMEPTEAQKTEWIIESLGILGFTENSDYPGVYTQEHGMKKIVKDLNISGTSYFLVDKKRVEDDDAHGTLAKVDRILKEAEIGQMPSRTEPDEVVNVKKSINQAEPVPKEPEDKAQPAQNRQHTQPTESTENNLLDLIQKYVGNDVLQVFGDTGAGKSKFGLETAIQAIAAGKKVYYLDTERNLTDEDVASLTGCEYKYTPVLDEIDKIVQKLPAVDVVILDSIGFPVLTKYARLTLKQKGDALLQLIAIFGDLKTWAYKNNGVAIVTNQPESEFNKEKGHIFRPFGDKSQFACKEIWKTKISSRSPTETNISINAFRSRSVGFGTKIATMKITDTGVEVGA